jgi:hypothetical protein
MARQRFIFCRKLPTRCGDVLFFAEGFPHDVANINQGMKACRGNISMRISIYDSELFSQIGLFSFLQ